MYLTAKKTLWKKINRDFTWQNIEDIDFSEYKDILEALKDGRKYYKSKKSRLINLKDIGMKNFLNMLDNLSYRKDLSQGILEVDKNKALFLSTSNIPWLKSFL